MRSSEGRSLVSVQVPSCYTICHSGKRLVLTDSIKTVFGGPVLLNCL